TIPPCRSRSAPTCSATTIRDRHGRCTGRASNRAKSGTKAMGSRVMIALKASIPLFAGKPSHSFVPLDHKSASARSEGQGRPPAGASRVPLTAASTLAGWRFGGERLSLRYAVILLTGGLALGAGPATTLAQSAPVARAVAADPHGGHIVEASQRFGIP